MRGNGATGATVAFCLILAPITGCWRPVITPGGPHLVVPRRGRLELRCHDDATSPAAPSSLKWLRERGRRLEGEGQEGGAASITVAAAQPYHMGRYTCVNNSTREHSSIYVYVKDGPNVFQRTIVNNILERAGENGVIPCLVTDPEVSRLTLETCDGRPLPSGMKYHAHLQRGVIISSVRKQYEGCYVCVAQLGGHVAASSPYTLDVLLVPETPPVILLSEKDTVILREGEPFQITCSSTNVNLNFSLQWDFPITAKPDESFTSNILSSSRGYQLSASLSIPAVSRSDSGSYRCYALNERGASATELRLDVREQGFFSLLGSPGPVRAHVREGESLSLRVEFDAYPAPSSWSWSYDGKQLLNTTEHVITVHQQKYRYLGALRLVRVLSSEGGVYTFSANHEDASFQHLFHVFVNSRPVIVTQEGPVDGQVRCRAAGYPLPKISWYFCQLPHTRCSHLPNATQWEVPEAPAVTEAVFGRREVESRLNVSHKEHQHYHTLECVASTEEEEAYTLFSISERLVPHRLFTPLLTTMVATGVLLTLVLMLLLYKYLQKPKFQIQWKVIESIHGNSYIYIDPTQLPYDAKWEFPRQKLRFGKTLGSGAFGKVVRATAYGLCSADTVSTVAVKMLKPNAHATEKEALMSELKVLTYLGNHVNIVNLLGACTVAGPILVITEYCCYGDLLNFLRGRRASFLNPKAGDDYYNISEQMKPAREERPSGYVPMRPSEKERSSPSEEPEELPLDPQDLLSFSFQVAKGMEYITSKNCIHRDLAARNVLLTHGRVAKICDFGLARDITTDANYVLRGNARLPVKWMSPESIFECVCTFESDVWSYGVLLWEIFSLGSSPYPGMRVDAAFYRMIQEGGRMGRPEFAPLQMYDIMLSCWSHDPLKRPSFRNLVERTELLLSENTRNVYLRLSNATAPPDQQRAPSHRLSSVCSTTAPTQPLLQSTADVFLDYV